MTKLMTRGQELKESLKDLHVVFVDDEDDIRVSFGEMLQILCARVSIFSSAQELLSIYTPAMCDLIITDISMPKMDGIEMSKRIRNIDPEQAIITMSAHHEKEILLQAFQVHVDGYIVKPFDISLASETLIQVANKIHKRKKSRVVQVEHKKVQETLQHYKRAVDKNTTVSKTDINGRITYVNDDFCKRSGFSREELIGSSHNILRHPDVDESFFIDLWSTLKSEKTFHSVIKNMKKNSETYFEDVYIFITKDDNGNPDGYISVRHDVTNEILRNKEETEMNVMKNELIANLNHELKTPLHAILGFNSVLRSKIDDPKALRYVDYIAENAKNMETIVERLILLSNLSSKTYKSKSILQDPFTYFYELHQKFALKAQESERKLEWDVDVPSVLMKKDYLGLTVILENLIDNAIKFTRIGGVVKVSVKIDERTQKFMIKIEDDGIGIAKDKLSKVFEPFTQQDSSATRSYDGLGLGLSLVKHMSEAVNATLEVESQENKGSKFKIAV